MYFDSFSEFLAMGGHGLYVWLAYGAFLILIVWNLVVPRLRRRQVLESLVRHLRREGKHREDAADVEAHAESAPLPYADQDS